MTIYINVTDFFCLNLYLLNQHFVDPLLFVETKVKLEAKHREEVNQEENKIDEDHAEQLRHLNDELTDYAKDELARAERNLVKRINELSECCVTLENITTCILCNICHQYLYNMLKIFTDCF